MPTYRWRCPACDTPNAADINVCVSCGCPAEASGFEVERHSRVSHNKEKIAMWRVANYSFAILFALLAALFTHILVFFVALVASVCLVLSGGYQVRQAEVDLPLIAGNFLCVGCCVLLNSPFGGDFLLIGLMELAALASMLGGMVNWVEHVVAHRKRRLSRAQ